ncbi:hypothetical protein D9M71_815590 [compost metagenome]
MPKRNAAGMPSIWKLSISKPRDLKLARLLSSLLMVMPGVFDRTSPMLVRCWSSICWRVMTLTDCGVSRGDSVSLVAVRVEPVV